MITVEYRDLFGVWRQENDREFPTIEAARSFCIEMSDATGIAYRNCDRGAVVDEIDLEADFWNLTAPDDQPPSDPDAG